MVSKFQEANQLQRSGQLEEAVGVYRQAIAENPDFYWSYHNLGETLCKLGRLDEAAEVYGQAVALNPSAAWSHFNLGEVLEQQGKTEEAIAVYQRAVHLNPKQTPIKDKVKKFQKIFPGSRKKNNIETIPKDDNIVESEPKTAQDYFKIGDKFVKLGKKKEALFAYQRSATLMLDEVYPYYQAVEDQPNNPHLYFQLGNSLVKQGLVDNAMVFYKIGLKIDPQNADINQQLGNILVQQGKLDRAVKYYRCAVELDPNCLEYYLQLGKTLEQMGQVEEAIASYQQALHLQPNHYSLVKPLGNLLEKQGRLGEAIGLYYQLNNASIGSVERSRSIPFNERVLFALHISWPYDLTGYTIRSHNILRELQNQSIQVLAATRLGYPWNEPEHESKPILEQDEIDEIRYVRLRNSSNNLDKSFPDYAYLESYAEQLVAVAKSHQASVIHSASNFQNGMAAILAAKKLGIKMVYELRGLWYLSRAAKEPKFQDEYWFSYQEMMERIVVHRSDMVITISQALKRKVLEWGVNSSQIAVIPNAVDTQKFYPRNPDLKLKQKLGFGKNPLIIGFIGSLKGYEGIDLLLKAIKGLIDRQQAQLSLLVVGEGEAKNELKKLAKSLSISNNVVFTGGVPFSEIPNYYSICDLCAFPRKNYEVCQYVPPLKVLEPMAMAKPVIVSNLPPLLEMVQAGKTGLVCQVNDIASLQQAVMKIYDNVEDRKRIGEGAKDWVFKNRSWKVIAQQYVDVYERLSALR
ncbi:glycosyltransferase family 4 protein [Limnoraphis robusta]|uniref:glycosyltransferase family 4 protein n=1 Tax=Limnoraphis robusta TaxID=1118279 RepID=UPI002B208C4E|nr:tetratricopeptide repeat protein [Limnoraphis robusta]